MHIETERKFMVLNDSFKREAVAVKHIRQGYIAHDGGNTVRVRLVDGRGVLTVKGPFLGVIGRPEWEKELTAEEAEPLFGLCLGGFIEKRRYIVPSGDGHTFEVDEFAGGNAPLVMAEVELSGADETFERPSWLGEEVTQDKRFYNSYLLKHPFSTW